jgi:hypothetical protein
MKQSWVHKSNKAHKNKLMKKKSTQNAYLCDYNIGH